MRKSQHCEIIMSFHGHCIPMNLVSLASLGHLLLLFVVVPLIVIAHCCHVRCVLCGSCYDYKFVFVMILLSH